MKYSDFLAEEMNDRGYRTAVLDVHESSEARREKVTRLVCDHTFGLMYLDICDGEELKESMQLIEPGALGKGKHLNLHPLETSSVEVKKDLDLEQVLSVIEEICQKEKTYSSVSGGCEGMFLED